ncbi:MAG TPA: electron-transfer flavoprotein:ubiquinone oxidoreductase, partial [Vampirovibrionales bacterium]
GQVWHTLGYPLTDGSFGGGFVYGMKDNQLTIGMVISLDSPNPNINPQQRLQGFKKHPWLQKMIAGGKLKNYGAAVLPEGGYYSLPKEFAVDGALLLGDALGVLDINSLAGIDKALECGIQAAEVIHEQINAKNDFSSKGLAKYKERLMKTHVGKALFKGRYFRHAFQTNPKLLGDYLPKILDAVDEGVPLAGFASIGLKQPLQAIKAALKLKDYIEGNKDFGTIKYKQDHEHIVPEFKEPLKVGFRRDFAKSTIYSREDAVFYSHTKYHEENKHIDEFNAQVCLSCIEKYDALKKETPCVSDCTAEVHRVDVKNDLRIHGMSLENCVQCRTCEIVCPERNLKVKPTAQGAGPDFMGM